MLTRKNAAVTSIAVGVVVSAGLLLYGRQAGHNGSVLPNQLPKLEPVQSVDMHNSNVQIDSLKPHDLIASPVTITGQAQAWYFEGVFPVRLVDEQGRELARGQAESQEDWMVDRLVPFKAVLQFVPGTAKKGMLILERSNPSGLAENAESIVIPVRFK